MKRATGTLFLILLVLMGMGCTRTLPPEQRAVRLVEDSRALGGDTSVKHALQRWLQEKGDEVKPIGWQVTRRGKNVYLVAYRYNVYSFKEGIGEKAFFFEVDLPTEVVRNVTHDFEREMKPLSHPFKEKEEVVEEVIERYKKEQDLISGKPPSL